MKKDLTELVFILDKSGSMAGLEDDTIGGFNAMLKKQQAMDGSCRLSTVLFNHEYELLHDRLDLMAVSPLTGKDYSVGGMTALLDAIGRSIHKISKVQEESKADYRASKVIFVIITDGYENSSREYSAAKVKALIKEKKEGSDWEFIFLGANIDAVETAGTIGIDSDKAVDYLADSAGTRLSYRKMSEAIGSFRRCGSVDGAALEDIRKDTREREARK